MKFTLGEVLSVTTGKLLCPIERVYDILNHMTGDTLYTHQLPRACRECKPHLEAQFPNLKTVDVESVTTENWATWLHDQIPVYGNRFDVKPLPRGAHEYIDPVSELASKVDPGKIIVVGLNGDQGKPS